MKSRKICVVTGSRSEYGLFIPILKKINKSEALSLQLISTSSHQSKEFGSTYKEIEKDGFIIDAQIENLCLGDGKLSVVKTTGLAISKIGESYSKLQPDIVLLLGDRYETLAAATAALLMNIPIAHIHGGEKTIGAVDEQIRHAITKMSSIHFCTTEEYRNRIIQMGEDPTKVFNSGAPGIDNIKTFKLLSKTQLEDELNWKFSSKTALFTYHPVTLEDSNVVEDITKILKSLEDANLKILFTYANADSYGDSINKIIKDYCISNLPKHKLVKNLGQVRYLSAMSHVDLIIGNSSSGIIEAASFKKPVINIGIRQKGRMKGANVIDCNIENISDAIELAFSEVFNNEIKSISNIYGEGNASDKIVEKLINEPISVIKNFKDLYWSA